LRAGRNPRCNVALATSPTRVARRNPLIE